MKKKSKVAIIQPIVENSVNVEQISENIELSVLKVKFTQEKIDRSNAEMICTYEGDFKELDKDKIYGFALNELFEYLLLRKVIKGKEFNLAKTINISIELGGFKVDTTVGSTIEMRRSLKLNTSRKSMQQFALKFCAICNFLLRERSKNEGAKKLIENLSKVEVNIEQPILN